MSKFQNHWTSKDQSRFEPVSFQRAWFLKHRGTRFSTTEGRFVKSAYSKPVITNYRARLNLFSPGRQNQTSQFSETQRQDWPCRKKKEQINPAQVTASHTERLISVGKSMCVITTTTDYKSIKNQNSGPTSFCPKSSSIWPYNWRNTGLLNE